MIRCRLIELVHAACADLFAATPSSLLLPIFFHFRAIDSIGYPARAKPGCGSFFFHLRAILGIGFRTVTRIWILTSAVRLTDWLDG